MKKLIILFLIPIINAHVHAQTPIIEWQKSLGGSNDEVAMTIKQTSDGGYIVAGNSSSNNYDVSGNHGSADYWVVKINDTGAIQWQKSLGGISSDQAYSIQQTSDGGYIVAGSTFSNDGNVTGFHGSVDYWIVKLNSSGVILWEKCLGGTGGEDAYSIQQTSDGGYIIAGQSNSNDGNVSGNHGGIDYWVVKLNDTGSIQWEKSLGGSGDDIAHVIRQTSDGGYIVAGVSNSTNGEVTGNHGLGDCWVVKLNDTGAVQWQKSFGGSNEDEGWSVQQTSDGGYIVGSRSKSNNGDVSGNHGGYDYWVVKINDTGAIQWQKSFGGSGDDYLMSIKQISNGGYIVAGWTFSNNGDVSGNHGSVLPDYWIINLSSSGSIQWQNCLGGSGDDEASEIQQTSDGGYIVAGVSNSTDGEVSGNHGGYDYWVVKLSPTLGIHNLNQNKIKVGPNPTNGNIYITGTDKANIKIYNCIGQLVKDANNVNYISISEFPSGLYLIKLFNEYGQPISQERIIKQ